MISVAGVKGAMPENSSEFIIKNANHERVLSAIDKLIHERHHRVCSCDRCVSDVVALALNILPPHYYVDSDQSKAFASPWVMIESAVAEAIERIKENPRHEYIVQPSPPCCIAREDRI